MPVYSSATLVGYSVGRHAGGRRVQILILLALVWAIGTPIAAIVALMRTGRLRDEISALRAQIAEASHRSSAAERQAGPATEPVAAVSPKPEPTPTPEPAPERARVHPAVQEPAAEKPLASPPEQASRRPSSAGSSWAQISASLERTIAANWLIWLGAAALALGGIFLVRYAWEQGYFGPMARTLAAVIAGLAMIGASEWLRRHVAADAPGQLRHAPLAVAAAGSITLYAAAYAAGPLYALIPSEWALAGFVAASVAAVALAVIHGPLLAALGLAGGYVAPLLVGGHAPAPLLLLAYAFAITLAALVLVRAFNWRALVWIALAGTGFWILAGVSWIGLPTGAFALAGYAVALVLSATWLAWSDADQIPLRVGPDFGLEATPGLNQTVVAAHGFWIAAGGGLLMALAEADGLARDVVTVALAVYGVAAVLAGWRREGFALAPMLGAAAFGGGLWLLPVWTTPELAVAGHQFGWLPFSDPDDLTYRFLAFAWLGAIVAGAGCWLAMRAAPTRAILAIVSAFTPLGLLVIAFDRLGQDQQHLMWGLASGLIGALNLLALDGLHRRPGGLDATKGAASAYALGAFAASMFAVGASLEQMWMTVLFAAHLPAIALVDRRFNLPALHLVASAVGAVVMGRLLWPGEILSYSLSATPVFNELLLLYGAPMLCFAAAGRLFASNAGSNKGSLPQAMDVAAIVLLAVLASMEIRHAVTAGHLDAGNPQLVETASYLVAFMGIVLGLAVRTQGSPRSWMKATGWLIYSLAVGITILGPVLLLNPLLSGSPARFDGPPLLNLLAPSYLAPAALFAIHSWLMRKQGKPTLGHVSGFIAMAMGLLYATLEIRHAFHADLSLGAEPVTEAETYCYSIGWIIYAIAMLLVGALRQRIAIRHAAMAVLALSVAKVFLFDMASLTGVLRAASFMGLGVALIAIAFLYQRLVFRKSAT